MTASFDRVVSALEGHGSTVKQAPGSRTASAQCPAHDDGSPSLSVTATEGHTLIHCHAGCEPVDVLAALDLGMPDLFDSPSGVEYRYNDGRRVLRSWDTEKGRKKFRQAGMTKTLPGKAFLYRVDRVRDAVAAGRAVFVVEGEKDVHALEAVGATATCSPMGAGNWAKVDPSPLYGGQVRVVADQDDPGRKHAAEVYRSLVAHASVAVFAPKMGKDAADHIAAGYGPDDFAPQPVTDPSASSRKLVLTPASRIPLRAPRWLWDTAPPGASGAEAEGRIPAGSLTIGAGRAGIGKSQHAALLAAHVTRGTLPGCHYGTAHSVIYAATEDSWSMTIAPRLVAAGADLERGSASKYATTPTRTPASPCPWTPTASRPPSVTTTWCSWCSTRCCPWSTQA